MKNVYQIGSGNLTFEIIERIINENLKLELAPEAKERIQRCRDYLDKKIEESEIFKSIIRISDEGINYTPAHNRHHKCCNK